MTLSVTAKINNSYHLSRYYSNMERGPIIARILCAAGRWVRWVRTRWVWAPRGGAAGRWSELGAGQCAWATPSASTDRLQFPLLSETLRRPLAECPPSALVAEMSAEKGSLGRGVEKGEEPEGTIAASAYSVKQADDGEEPMKVEVVVGADGCSDDLSCGEADLDPHLLGLTDDEEKCRKIRKQYRQLIHNVQQNRDDIVNPASDSLTDALEEADVLFDEVSRTREAALDAQFLVLASNLDWMEDDEHDELSGCDDNIALSFWETVQKEATSWILQAETFHFIFGSFKSKPAPKPRLEHHKKAHKMEENGDMPTKLRKLDMSNNQEATEKEVERILGLLQTYFLKYPDTPVSYFEFVIDPNSFSRTVENIFYVSFIIRDGFARIRLDQDRLPILEPININQVGEGNDPSSHGRKQGVISLSLQDWKNIVATFEISEAMITNSY
ncbi:EP300-interacting inhibitor of differentiation 3 [Mirounga angustirostris]|uniref:EP300-interacting inhibitor of differentiation 3 n=1 Tax=Mirounga angustirostris TaxID=9716 RepID=UPI00313CA30F